MGILLKISIVATLAFLLIAPVSGQVLRLKTADEYFIQFDPNINLQQLDQELSSNPMAVDILLKRARLRLLYGMDTEAMRDIELINTINPYAVYLYGFYGTGGYQQVFETAPADALVELSLAERLDYYRVYLYEELDQENITREERDALLAVIDTMEVQHYDQALEMLDAHLEGYPESAIAYDLKSVVYTELELLDEATDALATAISYDPTYALAWYNFGRIERMQGEYEMAVEYFDQAITLRANFSKAYFERAMTNKQLQNLEEAERDYTMIIEQDPALRDEAILNRGLARKMSGDFEGALEDLNVAIEVDPENAVLYKNRGNLFLLLGQLEDAMDDYDYAVSLDREFSEAYYNRGLTWYIMGETFKACEDLKESSRLGFTRADDKIELFCNQGQRH